MRAHTNISINVLNTNNERVKAVGYVCDCSPNVVTINITDIEQGDHLMSIAFERDAFERMTKPNDGTSVQD